MRHGPYGKPYTPDCVVPAPICATVHHLAGAIMYVHALDGRSSQITGYSFGHGSRGLRFPDAPLNRAANCCLPRRGSGLKVDVFGGLNVVRHKTTDVRTSVACQATPEKLTVAVTGATGLVGSRLVSKLTSLGHTVRVLTRNRSTANSKLPFARLEIFEPGQWQEAISGTDGVVNLAGEPISTRWTNSVKQEIKRSRIEGTRKLVAIINACDPSQRPQVLVSASAVGYYGTSQTETFKETSSAGSDYLSGVCQQWEAEAEKAETERTVILRTGIVLAKEGGALGKMLPVFNLFAGGPLGSGQQWCSWIHRDDLVRLFMEALTNPGYNGVYNATAPSPVRMSELCASLGTVLGRPSWLPVPDFAIQALLGEGAGVVLDGQKVLPSKVEQAGYSFQFPDVTSAVRNVLR